MSMAVVDDTPTEETEGTAPEGTAPAVVPEPTFLQILDRQLRFRGRQLFRAILIPIRSVFFLEEDSMRDQMIMGNRADIDLLAGRLAQAMQGINVLNERLSAHEEAIPRMRAVKEQFDNTKRMEKEKRATSLELTAKQLAEKDERLAAGILM